MVRSRLDFGGNSWSGWWLDCMGWMKVQLLVTNKNTFNYGVNFMAGDPTPSPK